LVPVVAWCNGLNVIIVALLSKLRCIGSFRQHNYNHLGTFTQRNYDHLGTFMQCNYDHLKNFRRRNYNHLYIVIQLQKMYRSKRTWWLSDFIFYQKPLYKSLHQSFFLFIHNHLTLRKWCCTRLQHDFPLDPIIGRGISVPILKLESF
jgi:hypothetical protein